MTDIIIAGAWFVGIGGLLGLILALAGKFLRVEHDGRIDRITELLPSANCGGCGYPGCSGYASAIVNDGAPCNKCVAGGDEVTAKISEIMGKTAETAIRYRAQVMCSGTPELAKKKYIPDGIDDCLAAERFAGGDKMCPNGCIGHGTCTKVCKFDAIHVINGVAVVNYDKCRACGACVDACPKKIIKLVPFDSKYWVGCMSVDNGAKTRSYCKVGCVSCRMCEKNCPAGAITVDSFLAHIDYDKCIGCGKCESVCPRKIIKSNKSKEQTMFNTDEDTSENAE